MGKVHSFPPQPRSQPKSRVLPKGALPTANTKYPELLKSKSVLFTVVHGSRGADSRHLPDITGNSETAGIQSLVYWAPDPQGLSSRTPGREVEGS